MKKLAPRMVEVLFVFLMSLLLVIPQGAFAQSHVVAPGDLQRDIVAASAARQQNVAKLQSLFASPAARAALKSANIDYQQVASAIPQLSNKDLAQLSLKSARAQHEFAAGQISNHDLLLILVGAAVLILVIVAVKD